MQIKYESGILISFPANQGISGCVDPLTYMIGTKKMLKSFVNEYTEIFMLDDNVLIKFKEPKRYNSFKTKNIISEPEKITDKELRAKYIYAEQIG